MISSEDQGGHRRELMGFFSAALAAICALGANATSSSASVELGPRRIVVETHGGRAIIDRQPIHIMFEDARGRTLLSEVGGVSRRMVRLTPTQDPEPFALEREPDSATYGPLTFEVGHENLEQWRAGLWNGNVLFSRRQGKVHLPRSVVAARTTPAGGVRMVVTTTSANRRMIVRVEPDRGPALRVRAHLTNARNVITFGDSFLAKPKEGFYGLGGRHGTVDKHGEKVYGYTEQENLGGQGTLQNGAALLPALTGLWTDYTIDELGGMPQIPSDLPGGFVRYQVPNGANGAYYPQAQFISSRGYGFLLNQDQFSRWRMGNDHAGAWQVQASARNLDYTVILARRPARAMKALTDITGRHRLPPKWAQGPVVWRAIQVPPLPGLPAAETPASYRAKIEQDLTDIETYQVHLSAYAFEGWALLGDVNYLRSVIGRLHARGIRVILYHRAYVANDTLNSQPPGDYAETMNKGLVAKTADGKPYIFGANGGGPATLLDFTNPDTRRWWARRLRLTLDLGMDGFMQDFGEQVQGDMHFANGETGRIMHNRYPVIWARLSRRILDHWQEGHPGRGPIWFFTRAGYSGRPGSAAYEMGNFPGDETTDWSISTGLGSLGPDMLNRAVGGAFGYSTDIGGYTDFQTPPPNAELFTRWSEWSALTPYFRVHNSASTGTRMPWFYGPETLATWKSLAELHQRALQLIRRLWRQGRKTGMPVTRPMWLGGASAPRAHTDPQQWLLGASVLVAPVLTEGATIRSVNLPRGCWEYQAPGRPRYVGPATRTVPAPLGQLPYFFRCGKRPF
jgi:sulfoquinovosidase